ncbi:MAG: DMT family transporter [Oscillospiraceae bacterium]|nr:DMT family transporter [Oscillospiraceae bacterium]
MNNKAVWGRLALLLTAFIWGTSFVVLKNALDSIGILWILAIRFTVSALLLGLAAGKKLRKLDRRTFRGSMIIGAFLATAYIVQTFGLKYTTPGKNAFLTATYCVLVPFLAWLIYKRRPGAHNLLAAVLCLTGIGFVSLSGAGSGFNKGDALTLGCGIFYALQIIAVEQYIHGGDAVSISAVEFATAALICWVGALLFEPAPGPLSGSMWLTIAYLSVACTALCFFLQAWGMQYTSSSTAAVLMTLESVFGTLVSVLFYHEPMTVKLVIGFALIFFAVLLSETGAGLFARRKRP